MFSSGDRTRPVNSDEDPGDDGARDLDLQEGSSIEMEAELERVVPAKDDEPDTTITKPRLQPQLSSSALSGRQSAKKSNKESRSEQGSKIISTSKQHRKTDQQSAMESGVAQIANIGSIISSTFGVFNDRFSKFDDILEQSTRRTEEISGESRSQMNKISFLKNAVDGMQDQMMEMISSVQQLQVNVAEALNQKKSEEAVQAEKVAILDREETLAKHEQIEIQATALKQQRDELLDRIMDLEREIQLIKTRPVQPEGIPSGDAVTAEVASIASVALSKQRDELQISVSGLEKKIDEHEALLHNTRLTIVNLDIAAIAEDKVVGIQHLSIKLKKIDFGDEPLEDGSESEVISSKWEPALPPQDVGVATDVFSEKKKTPRVSIAAAVNNEAMQLMAESIAKMREDAAIDRETAAATIEEMNQRILELENVVATHNGNNVAQVRDINERLLDLQDGVQSAAGATTAIKRLQLSMNDVIAEVDELKYKESSPNDDVVSSGQQIGGHPQGPPDHLNTASLLLDIEINSVKNKLLNLRDDLDNGLDTYADAHAGDPEGTDAFESPFIARVAEFADRLDNVILSFYPKETPEATLLALFYPLDALTIELESLFELDQQSVSMMGITFDDVTAEGSNRNVRDTMRHVWEASLPLLDHRVNKITMRRRLTALEGIVRNKADVVGITVLEAELRRLISSKADHKELLSIASKKVSLGELQRLKDQLMKQIVSIRGFEYSQSGTSGPVIGTPRDRSGEGGLTSAEGLEMSAEMKQLGRRFDILHSFHEDLAAQCGAYVPREEVEQALRALLGEMKIMKGNSISPDLLGESLKTKANAAEVQKLVAALTGALGDISGKHDVASAIYARCLICDKPVKSLVLAPLTSNKGPRAFSPDRGSTNQYSAGGGYYDKNSDRGFLDRPSTIGYGGMGTGGSIGSGSMGFAAWGSSQNIPQPHSLPLSPSYSSNGLALAGAIPNHSSFVPGNLRSSSAPDTNNNSEGATPSGSHKAVPRVVTDYTVSHSLIDLPPLQIQFPQGLSKGKNSMVYKQPGHGRVRAQGAAGGGTGPSYSLDTR